MHQNKGDVQAGQMLDEFMAALVAMFNQMDAALCRKRFEWQNDLQLQIGKFLGSFDFIFTLPGRRHWRSARRCASDTGPKAKGAPTISPAGAGRVKDDPDATFDGPP